MSSFRRLRCRRYCRCVCRCYRRWRRISEANLWWWKIAPSDLIINDRPTSVSLGSLQSAVGGTRYHHNHHHHHHHHHHIVTILLLLFLIIIIILSGRESRNFAILSFGKSLSLSLSVCLSLYNQTKKQMKIETEQNNNKDKEKQRNKDNNNNKKQQLKKLKQSLPPKQTEKQAKQTQMTDMHAFCPNREVWK